jgi:uncharacterized protein YjbI with pentapeptide repeats
MDSKLNLSDIRQGRVKDLSNANLVWADLSGADLTMADLSGADLVRTNLRGADLTGADLTGADLTMADLTRVKLDGPELMQIGWFERSILPARLLPWLSAHPRFGQWLPGLTVMED